MVPKPRFLPMPRDDLVLKKRNEAVERWLRSARTDEAYQKGEDFILQCKQGSPKTMHPVIKGGYNLVYRLEYEDGTSVVMRVPIKDLVPSPEEKILYEVSTMRYVAANSTIPVPHVYCHGTASENPTGLGPFIVMDYIAHHTNMSRELLDPAQPPDSRPVLDPDISEGKLELLYGQMANILLQLHSLGPFPAIGSIVQDESVSAKPDTSSNDTQDEQPKPKGDAQIKGRPLIMNTADLIIDTNAPRSILPPQTKTYPSSREWYADLADMHMAQLVFQRNNCVENEDEDDIRDKYVARTLFRRLVSTGKLLPSHSSNTTRIPSMPPEFEGTKNGAVFSPEPTFRLFSEDLRPANVLLDKDLQVVGVVDWEFVYSAPEELSCDPPWWLLLRAPEDYPGGLVAWMRDCETRLGVFLRVLESEERRVRGMKEGVNGGGNGEPKAKSTTSRWAMPACKRRRRKRKTEKQEHGRLLSERMRESWETGRWMVNYAARKSWMFDLVWWRFLDEAYFGINQDQDHKARLGLLGEKQMAAMEKIVQRKMEEMRRPELAEWDERHVGLLREMLVPAGNKQD